MTSLKSMTGFGRAEHSNEAFQVAVEVRAVNHRFLDIVLKTSRDGFALEDALRRVVESVLHRGRIEIGLTLEGLNTDGRRVKLNENVLRGYLDAFTQIEAEIGQPVDANHKFDALLVAEGVFMHDERAFDADLAWAAVEPCLREALAQVVHMRQTEGSHLQRDILNNLAHVRELVEQCAEHVPAIVERYRDRLQRQVQQWEAKWPVAPESVAAEIALFAERADVSEEFTRLESHMSQMHDMCTDGSGPVGRRLDFLLQEMFREINTVASKAQGTQLTALIVEAKALVEKMREQAQNVE